MSNIPKMLRRMVRLARTTGTSEDRALASAYERGLEVLIRDVEGTDAPMVVNFATELAATEAKTEEPT